MILEFKCDTSQNRVGSLITEIFLTLIYTSLAKSMHSYFLPFLHELCLVIYRCTNTLARGFALNLRLKHSSPWGILVGFS